MTARSLPRLDEDTRLIPILDNLSNGFLAGVSSEWGSATEGKSGEISADMVDHLAKNSFPLCMRTLHDALRRDHHLKHFGRLQYGLFLKVHLLLRKYVTILTLKFDSGTRTTHRGGYCLLEEIL